MKSRFTPPFFGAAYYPEDWPLEQVDEDIALMKRAGMNAMRITEFAWSSMEPEEGVFTFDWVRTVVDKLAAAGIATVMGTPSATPPAWLTTKYPEVLFVTADGHRVGHGGRRHTCPNNPRYRELSCIVTAKMAEEFGHDDRIIGWQIDNEVCPHYDFTPVKGMFTRSCCCPVCMSLFHAFLEDRYGTIDALNKAWCLHLWSMDYDSFSQIAAPDMRVWHHPSFYMAWDEFSSRSWVAFVKAQADVLHAMTAHLIGTDMMPFHEVSHYDMNAHLDVVQYNHYDFKQGFRNAACWFDFLRPIKDRPFWNTESSSSWGGGTAVWGGTGDPGFCRANCWLPIALGAETQMFWLWRTHWAGHELFFGSVVSSEGRPLHIMGEVQEVAEGFRKSADFLNGTKPVKTGLAAHFTHYSGVTFKSQAFSHDFDFAPGFMEHVYHPLITRQYRPDVIDSHVALDDYKVIMSPFLPTLDENGLRDKLKKWIEAGGIWIAGPLADNRDIHGAKYRHAPFSVLEEWGGFYTKFEIPGGPHARSYKVQWNDGTEGDGALWYLGLESRGAEMLASFTTQEMKGLGAIARNKMGKGQVITCGTVLSGALLDKLLALVSSETGIAPVAKASANLMVVPRAGESGEGLILVELDNKPATCVLPRPGVNLLTGETVSGLVEIEPYGVAVIKY